MSNSETIAHKGIIRENKDGNLKINLLNTSACASCHVKSACSVAETDNKVIEVSGADTALQQGDRVEVKFGPSMEFKALFFGYMFPFLIVLVSLLAASQWMGEALAGVLALSALIPYYAALALFRKHLKKTFSFTVHKT